MPGFSFRTPFIHQKAPASIHPPRRVSVTSKAIRDTRRDSATVIFESSPLLESATQEPLPQPYRHAQAIAIVLYMLCVVIVVTPLFALKERERYGH